MIAPIILITPIYEREMTISNSTSFKSHYIGAITKETHTFASMAETEDLKEILAEELPGPKTRKQKLWNIAKMVLKFSITVALLYWVFTKVPVELVKDRLLHANYWWMLVAAFSFFCSMIVSSWRLLSFFRSMGLKINPIYNVRLYFLGMFYNFLLPGGIGGDGYKVYLINKTYKVPVKKLLLAIMFDRLSGLWAIGCITIGLVSLMPQVIPINILIPIGAFIVLSGIYYFVVYKFFNTYSKYFWQAHAKAIVLQAFQILAIVCVLFGQNFDGKFAPYLLSFLISAFGIIIPTAGGAGAREAIVTKLTEYFPMDKSLAVFLPSSFYLISLFVALLGIYYVIWPSKLSNGLPREAPEEKAADKVSSAS